MGSQAAAGGEIVVRPLEAGDAEALVRCFRRGYGDSYVSPRFYDAAQIRARVAEGRLRPVVAVTDAGEIVGHMALSVRRAGDRTTDAGNTLVDPRYRSQHLAARRGVRLAERCRDEGFVGFHHYPTTAHPVMQKLAVAGAARAHPADVVHVDLSLADPAVAPASETLREQGFFLCALLPEYRDGDVLRLQRISRAELPDATAFATDEARDLIDFLERDRA